ncbi:MAG TPA: FumA C-terminus/TtdB family hydratase beta subunit [Methanotrichaceae archaeon]|nr:FumA C-terminus/TtdB family hydratase beta subunit [Methanotrichaceae archaeon]HQF15675.1 FumA C-terminus/TtdB family hydratase beta subunit [Methanotrichaceae archaeon]HQI90411.1 FumA C-terminus/TtdB family hydratase beta subunit [Methanotrichaceae archaeon]HQJ28983.1 FumA C-terminus/TtdB family hydratase beta subunit [Methanotrichaceae archaeon]
MDRILRTPAKLEDILDLEAGDFVSLSGRIYTARDKAHAAIRERGAPVDLVGSAIYHCGPIMQDGRVICAGPTTSSRLTRYTEEMLDRGVRIFIGKGGLPGDSGLIRGRAVYLAYTGGCGAAAARQLKAVRSHLPDLGMAEAVWELEAIDMGPMIVAMDAHGRDIYEEVRSSVRTRLAGKTDSD